ncbi:hypothetical protein EXU57_21000 [Segetibacter sp. 3557_3]|uniref:hypothetical protein n=1 Tax=Segetibacter sp. 3557_3 TaxID=2547429 RepID=UPI001058BEB6|nr:hypothetical protein [Segetibacter sp. 3557_3]TDH20873.1 hypothetical protein EXU57_21000 [Segetibacter sp. 3557_3]
MKKVYSLLCLLLICLAATSQSYTGQTKINKISKMAIINELPFNADVTEDAIKKRMSQLGLSAKKDNGYLVFKNVSLPELGPATYNLYFKSERKSKKEDESALLYMLISDSYDSFISESSDPELISNGKRFLNTFNTPAAGIAIENDIRTQEEGLKKAEKRYNNAVDEGRSLEEKRRKIDRDIEENRKDQEQKKVELERQRQAFEAARSKRAL